LENLVPSRKINVPTWITHLLLAIPLALFVLWLIPANETLLFPGASQNVASLMHIQGRAQNSSGSGVYDTYVDEYPADRLLYVMWGLAQSDVSVLPQAEVTGGCPSTQYQQAMLAMMSDSKVQAEASAFNLLGYPVKQQRKYPEIDQVDCSVPAASVLRHGDRVLAVDGHSTPTIQKVIEYTRCFYPGCKTGKKRPAGSLLPVTIRRAGKIKHVTVRTIHAKGPTNQIVKHGGHALIGVSIAMPLKLPNLHVSISTPGVGGPSAGLAFALGIIQQICYGHNGNFNRSKDCPGGSTLTRGNKVAVTGEIEFDTDCNDGLPTNARGLVCPIGGARQKAVAAAQKGAHYFLVPRPNLADARSAHANLLVCPVSTLGDALHVLASLPPPAHQTKTCPS
jgi:PDZ domain-containing protein